MTGNGGGDEAPATLGEEAPAVAEKPKRIRPPGLAGTHFDLGSLLACRVGVQTPTLAKTLNTLLTRVSQMEEKQDSLLASGVSSALFLHHAWSATAPNTWLIHVAARSDRRNGEHDG